MADVQPMEPDDRECEDCDSGNCTTHHVRTVMVKVAKYEEIEPDKRQVHVLSEAMGWFKYPQKFFLPREAPVPNIGGVYKATLILGGTKGHPPLSYEEAIQQSNKSDLDYPRKFYRNCRAWYSDEVNTMPTPNVEPTRGVSGVSMDHSLIDVVTKTGMFRFNKAIEIELHNAKLEQRLFDWAEFDKHFAAVTDKLDEDTFTHPIRLKDLRVGVTQVVARLEQDDDNS
jgi:hypothetical protein